MPVDTTRVISTRRTQKQISEEELKDIELKRLRGELSCAECRRLKLRCDKKVPCGSCLRRGCESICPCGILSAGQGTRFILADTDQLHRKIADMSNRIRQLEDALAILQASVSDERHPLLSDEHLKMKFGSEALDPKKPQPEPTEEEKTKLAIDALGTLTLGESGEMKYFGRSAGSEALMMAEDQEEEDSEEEPGHGLNPHPMPLSPELSHLESSVPLLSHREPTLNLLLHFDSFLPLREKATALCEVYLNHGAFFFRPVKREELYESLLPSVYQAALLRSSRHDETANAGAAMDDNAPHATATLFFIFALGALLDVQLAPYNGIAEHYYHLGKAALGLRPVCGSPSLETVSAVGLMATYHNLAGKKYSRDSAWCIMGLAAKLAQSFGLHRDSARWSLDPKTVQKRRNLFWEVFASDVSHSLALGRPPAIHLSYVDCEFPQDDEATLSDSGEKLCGFWALKHLYAKDIFYAVAEATLTAKAPSYETILDLDRRVREMSYQSASKPYASRSDGQEIYHSSSLSLRDFYISQYRTVVMIYLHRSFFAQAVLDHPSNPLLSSFAPSFLTAYRCASVIIKASLHQFDRCASMAKRIWFLLYHTFSAAVIAGTIITRSPHSTMAPNAMKDLDAAVQLFEQAADQSHRAKIALTVLKRLQEKAHRCYKSADKDKAPSTDNASSNSAESPTGGSGSDGASSSSSIPSPVHTKQEDDELAIFGGQIRVVTKKGRSKDSRSKTRSRTRSISNERAVDSSPSPDAPSSTHLPSTAGPSTIPADFARERSSLSPLLPSSSFDFPSIPDTFSGGHNAGAFREQHLFNPSTMGSQANGISTPGLPGHLSQHRRPSINTINNAMNTDWMTNWDFGMATTFGSPGPTHQMDWLSGPRSTSSSADPFTNFANGSTNAIPSSSSGSTGSPSRTLPSRSVYQGLDFPMVAPAPTPTTAAQYGSDSVSGHYPQSSHYDLQEKAALLDHDMDGAGARTPMPYRATPPRSSPNSRPDVAATAAFLNSLAMNHPAGGTAAAIVGPAARAAGIGAAYGGGDLFGSLGLSPGPTSRARLTPGAVELGLSGESRLDAGWIAFMRDCGIFGVGSSPR